VTKRVNGVQRSKTFDTEAAARAWLNTDIDEEHR
jgi:hypothetical protein